MVSGVTFCAKLDVSSGGHRLNQAQLRLEDGEELAPGHVPAARGRVRPRNLLVGGEPGRQRRGGTRLADGKVHARGPVAVIMAMPVAMPVAVAVLSIVPVAVAWLPPIAPFLHDRQIFGKKSICWKSVE